MADIVKTIVPPRTDDPIELERWYRAISDRQGFLSYAGDPSNVVIPRWAGDMCFDSIASDWYLSSSTTAASWSLIGDGTSSVSQFADAVVFTSDTDSGISKVGADEFGVVVGGEEILRFKRSGSDTIMGHPENFNGAAPFFEVSERYSTPAILGQNILMTGEADTCDIALRMVNGSSASPTTVLDKEWCGQVYWWPFDGTNYGPGALYGAALNSTDDWYDDAAGGAGAGPYNFTVELNEDSPSDIAIFVEDAASTTMSPANMKTKTTHYTFTYNHATKALAVTFTAGNEPAAGTAVWAFMRYDWSMTAPFYGRQGAIKTISTQAPTRTARGGVMTFEVCKDNQIATRPRMWLDGTTGNLVVAGKAVHEGDIDGPGKYYPDRDNTGGSYKNGCPSGICPVDYRGKGSITIPLVDIAADAAIALRTFDDETDGWDIGWDRTANELRIYTVSGDVRTPVWRVGTSGALSPVTDSAVNLGATAARIATVYADALVGTGHLKYVSRGDPAAFDYEVGDFTTDDAYHDLDLSAIVPAGAVMVRLFIQVIDDAASSLFRVRKNGNANEILHEGVRTQAANVATERIVTIECDSNRVIEYKADNTTFTQINVAVAGWYLET